MTLLHGSLNIAALFLTSAFISTAMAQATPATTPDDKVKNAMSAGPEAIAKDATVRDWPAKEGAEPPVLRKGSNQWTCFPNYPASPGNDPMCLDVPSMEWVSAWIAKKPPKLKQPGIGYMLQGGSDASNTDPFAQAPAPGQQWVTAPPHIMVFPAGDLDPKVYGTAHTHGTPWVMFDATPYEHLMIPVK